MTTTLQSKDSEGTDYIGIMAIFKIPSLKMGAINVFEISLLTHRINDSLYNYFFANN